MAHSSAVEPSRAGSLTLTRLASCARTACTSSLFAALTSAGSAPAACPTIAEITKPLARVVGRSQRSVRRVHIVRPTSFIGAQTGTPAGTAGPANLPILHPVDEFSPANFGLRPGAADAYKQLSVSRLTVVTLIPSAPPAPRRMPLTESRWPTKASRRV